MPICTHLSSRSVLKIPLSLEGFAVMSVPVIMFASPRRDLDLSVALGFTIEDICHLSEGQVSVEKAFELGRFLGNKCSRNSLYVVMFTSGGRVLDLSMAQDSPLRIFVTCQRCRSMLKDL